MQMTFTPKVPQRRFLTLGREIVSRMEASLMNSAEGIRRDFEKTVATWTTKPVFVINKKRTSDSISVFIGTDDEIYGYVEKGTRPHVIVPRNVTVLRFRSGYKAKTTPYKMASQAGGASGPHVYAKRVYHPGTKPRNFVAVITNTWAPTIAKELQQVIYDAV